jgi:hypothetical protein
MTFSLKIHHVFVLLFLPADETPGTFNELSQDLFEESSKVTECFKNCTQ